MTTMIFDATGDDGRRMSLVLDDEPSPPLTPAGARRVEEALAEAHREVAQEVKATAKLAEAKLLARTLGFYSEDQPRAPDGRFGEVAGDRASSGEKDASTSTRAGTTKAPTGPKIEAKRLEAAKKLAAVSDMTPDELKKEFGDPSHPMWHQQGPPVFNSPFEEEYHGKRPWGEPDGFGGQRLTMVGQDARNNAEHYYKHQLEDGLDPTGWDKSGAKTWDPEAHAYTVSYARSERERVVQAAYLRGGVDNGYEAARQALAPGMSREAWDKAMLDVVHRDLDGKPVVVRLPPSAVLKVLADGHFKTQFEAGATTKGLKSNERRAHLEDNWFGTGEDLPPEQRPVYGHISVEGIRASGKGGKEILTGDDRAAQFGNVQVVMKDAVKERTTFLYGDSMDQKFDAFPSPLTKPDPRSVAARVPGHGGLVHAGMDGDPRKRDVTSPEFRANQYVEVQIHGGVTTGDIAKVVFTDKNPTKAHRAALEAAGIPWEVVKS